jgi:hypothetical protein
MRSGRRSQTVPSPSIPESSKKFRHRNQRGAARVLRPLRGNKLDEDMTMDAIGRKRWAIAEGHIPSQSSFTDRALISHETACVLNAGSRDAHVAITIFFADRDPVGPYRITVPPRRTHLRFNDLTEPSPVPRDTDFSSLFESDVPIVVQHTRLDSRHAEVSLLSTTAYSEM